jgi:hypothetical protein
MDPEDLREIISAYQNCVADTVTRFGGFVAKYMGDGVLVYFGYPQAHEDDAERAVRAAPELVAAVSALSTASRLQTCSPHHQDSALYPLIVHLERAAGFDRDDAPETKLVKLEGRQGGKQRNEPIKGGDEFRVWPTGSRRSIAPLIGFVSGALSRCEG